MWATRSRRSAIINFIGLTLTFLYGIYDSVQAICSGCINALFLSDYTYETIWSGPGASKYYDIEESVRTPLAIMCQLMFYFKYFTYFWTLDPRDNKISYYLYHSKNRNNSFYIPLNARKLNLFINILIVLYGLVVIIGTILIIFINLEWYEEHYIFAPINIFCQTFFRRIPHSLHVLVITLYLFEWKCRIKYFHEIDFLKCVKAMDENNNNSLIFKYKKLRKLMMYQLFWIKLWMFQDLVSAVINIWYKLYEWNISPPFDKHYHLNKWQQCRMCDFIFGIFVIIYYSMGVVITWLMAASLSEEAEDLFQFAVQRLEELSPNYQINDDGKISQIQLISMANGNDSNSNEIDEYRLDNLEQVQEIQTFLLYYNEKPLDFKVIGVKISYQSLANATALFVIGKVVDYLWGTVY